MKTHFIVGLITIICASSLNSKASEASFDHLAQDPMQFELGKGKKLKLELLENITPGAKLFLGKLNIESGKTSAEITCELVTNPLLFPENNKGMILTYSQNLSTSGQLYGKILGKGNIQTGNYSRDLLTIAFEDTTRIATGRTLPNDIVYDPNTGHYYQGRIQVFNVVVMGAEVECEKFVVEQSLREDGRKFMDGISPYLKLSEFLEVAQKQGVLRITLE